MIERTAHCKWNKLIAKKIERMFDQVTQNLLSLNKKPDFNTLEEIFLLGNKTFRRFDYLVI